MMVSFSGEEGQSCGGCVAVTAMASATANQPSQNIGKKRRSGSASGFWLVTIVRKGDGRRQ
jgi:hypothetical protein